MSMRSTTSATGASSTTASRRRRLTSRGSDWGSIAAYAHRHRRPRRAARCRALPRGRLARAGRGGDPRRAGGDRDRRRASGSARATSWSSAPATTRGGWRSAPGATTTRRPARARPGCMSTPCRGCTSGASPRSCPTATARPCRATSRACPIRSTRCSSPRWACASPTACSSRSWREACEEEGRWEFMVVGPAAAAAGRHRLALEPDRHLLSRHGSPHGRCMNAASTGKVALVTGATTGIGQATAVRLASEGALVARQPASPTVDADRDAAAWSRRRAARPFRSSPTCATRQQVTAMVKEVAQRGGRLDYVVSNAAINPVHALGRDLDRGLRRAVRDQCARRLGRLHRGRQADDRRGPWRRHRA